MFIQRDPIGLLGGVNVFAYAPNPIHWVDVLGLNKIRATLNLSNNTSHHFEIKATSGAKNVPMRTEDAEQKLLKEIMSKFPKDDLKNSSLEIISQPTFIKVGGKTIPINGINPCQFCNNAMDMFAKDNDMKITYTNGKKVFEYPKTNVPDKKC